MPTYQAFGLTVRSVFPLPYLSMVDVENVPDVVVDWGYVGVDSFNTGSQFSVLPNGLAIQIANVGIFLISDGCRIIVEPFQPVSLISLGQCLLCPSLAIALHQRGLLVLHASGVVIDGQVIAFLGRKGCGKSTTAMALHARGHSIVADDVLPVNCNGNRIEVAPGPPIVRLSREFASVYSTILEPIFDQPMIIRHDKNLHKLIYKSVPVYRPLNRVYLLIDGQQLNIERLPIGKSIGELVRHSYFSHLISEMVGAMVDHFQLCAHLVAHVPVSLLYRPRDFSKITDLAEFVEHDK